MIAATTVSPGRHLVRGAGWTLLSEALLPLTGLITAGFLTRRLGAANYGLLTLTATVIVWSEFCITSLFARGTVKLVGAAENWRPLGTMIVQMHLLISTGVMLLVWLLAGPLAAVLREPGMAAYLRLYAVEIPLFALSQAHRHILVALGGFRQRALAGAARWVARLVLILGLVGLGLSVNGAILAGVGAMLVELIASRYFVRPSLLTRPTVSSRALWDYAVPLFLSAVSLRLFRLDLFLVKALGGSAEQTGYYGAAQNLAFAPNIVALSLAPLLLSTLTRVLRDGQEEVAKGMARDAMRAVILVLPAAGLVAGAGGEIVRLILGASFAPAGPLLGALIVGSLGLIQIGIATAILTAGGKPRWTILSTGPLVPLAAAGYFWLIPWRGAMGAALVTTGCSLLGAVAMMVAVYRLWGIAPPMRSWLRSGVLSAGAYALAAGWPAPGLMPLLKLPLIGLLIVAGYWLLGEFTAQEIAWARSLLPAREKERALDERPS